MMRVRRLFTLLKWQHQGQSLFLPGPFWITWETVRGWTKHWRCSSSRWRCQDTFTAQLRSPRGTKPAMLGRLILSSSGRHVGPKLLCTQGFPSLITHLCFYIGLTALWLWRFLYFLSSLTISIFVPAEKTFCFSSSTLFTSNVRPSCNGSQTLNEKKVLPWWCEAVRTPKHRLWERYSVLTAPEGRANSSLLEGHVIAFRVSVLCSRPSDISCFLQNN